MDIPTSRRTWLRMPSLKDFGEVRDPVRFEHVMNIVATCSAPVWPGRSPRAPDGVRSEIWPIVGGRFEGIDGLRGSVVPGGADLPHIRPDGAEWVDALYRLRTDDGTTIIIHNKGFYSEQMTRLQPEFKVTRGPYDWLNRSVFIATLVVEVPPALRLAKGPHQNDRLIQVFRVG